MTEDGMLSENNMSTLDRRILKALLEVAPEWKTRRQISRLIGGNLNASRLDSLNILEQWGLIETRQTGVTNKIRWEYRAKDQG